MTSKQLTFELPSTPTMVRGSFFVSEANAVALAMVEAWPVWAGNKLVISGPKSAGKTHLTHIWAAQSEARIVQARQLHPQAVPDLATGPIAVEDVPDIAQDAPAQEALFHLHNLVLAEGFSLLMTGQADPKHWRLSLPDLQSRVQGTQTAALAAPDDDLLAMVLAKLFDDRQLVPSPELIPFLVPRMGRSFADAEALVDALDRTALAEKRNLTARLARDVLETLAPQDPAHVINL